MKGFMLKVFLAMRLRGGLGTLRSSVSDSHLELPGETGHDVDGISAANTHSAHTESCATTSHTRDGVQAEGAGLTSSVDGVAVGADHHAAREGVVLEYNLQHGGERGVGGVGALWH
jgi:hypothetical protein